MGRASRTGTVLIAVNPFKGSLSAREVAEACGRGVRAMGWTADLLPGADGGDGLLDALHEAEVVIRTTRHVVTGPYREPVTVEVGWVDEETAVIESRFVVGLGLVPATRRDPGTGSTEGVGSLILDVQEAGAGKILVGLGGSATMDGGLGMAAAWGWSARDSSGAHLEPVGRHLSRVAELTPGVPPRAELVALVDVESPLLGAEGARRYAAQKGASRAQAVELERGLRHLVGLLGRDGAIAAAAPGSGAAGGLAFGMVVFAEAKVVRGSRWVLDRVGFAERLQSADAVITAEGGFDATSLTGKLTGTVIRRALAVGIPVGLLAPSAEAVPGGLEVETGGGEWGLETVEARASALVKRLGRLPPP